MLWQLIAHDKFLRVYQLSTCFNKKEPKPAIQHEKNKVK